MNILKRKELIDKIMDYKSDNWVKLIVGIRKSGKTVLLKSIMEELKNQGVDESNIKYYSLKDFKSNEFRKNYWSIKKELNQIDGEKYLFFDDVEEIPDWQLLVNAFRIDGEYEIYVAANYSKLYSPYYNHTLGGHFFKFKVYPFSFNEFITYKHEFDNVKLDDESIKELFKQYLKYGGIPEVLNFNEHADKIRTLEGIWEIIKIEEIRNNLDIESFLLEYFLDYMLLTAGEKFSNKQFRDYIYDMMDSEDVSVCQYHLTKSLLMSKSEVPYNMTRSLFDRKYYLIDHGFYNLKRNYYFSRLNQILRNIIYIELKRRGYKVFFCETREKYVDFICTNCNRQIMIQFNIIFLNDDIIDKEIESLNYHGINHDKYIITTGNYDLPDKGVKHLNIIDFLLGDEI